MTTEELMSFSNKALEIIRQGGTIIGDLPVDEAFRSLQEQANEEADWYAKQVKDGMIIRLLKTIRLPPQTQDEAAIEARGELFYEKYPHEPEGYIVPAYSNAIRGCKYLRADYCEGYIITDDLDFLIPFAWNLIDMDYVLVIYDRITEEKDHACLLTTVIEPVTAVGAWDALFNMWKKYSSIYAKRDEEVPEDRVWNGSIGKALHKGIVGSVIKPG